MTIDDYKAFSEAVKRAIENPCPFAESYMKNLKEYLAKQFEAFK